MRKLAIKAAAKVVKDAFLAKGVKVTHTEALDLIAKLQGFEAWSHLSQVVPVTAPPVVAKPEPLTVTLWEVVEAYYGVWGQCTTYPKRDWQHETEDGDTTQGYWDWAIHNLEIALDDSDELTFLDTFVKPAPISVTLLDGTPGHWNIQQNLSTRDGDLNGAYYEQKPALALLQLEDDLLEKLRAQMYSEDTFIVFKDGKFGILWEFEYCSTDSDGDLAEDGWKPHDVVVSALLKGLNALAPEYPSVTFCVPDPSQVVRGRPAVWGFVPVSFPLTEAQQSSLSTALYNL
jgi:hypothetical protein